MIQGIVTRERMGKWRIVSPEEYGFHKMIVPGRENCQAAAMYRLNLAAGQRYELMPGGKEMNGVCIKGETGLELAGRHYHCSRFDSFYTMGENSVAIGAKADCVLYIGTSVGEGYGTPSFRAFNPRLPLGKTHQIHGGDMGQRGVLMTLNQKVQVSRLIAGSTWGGNDTWTSWPLHQRETNPEKVYCYFDMDEPHLGLHLSRTVPGDVDNIVAHSMKSGDMVLAPRGYHPTVASPGTRNIYLQMLAAHSHEDHSYDLAILDPRREQMD